MPAATLERRLQIAGIVLLLGLVVEVLSLLGKGSIAFLVFAGLCATLILAGIVLYLYGIVSKDHPRQETDG